MSSLLQSSGLKVLFAIRLRVVRWARVAATEDEIDSVSFSKHLLYILAVHTVYSIAQYTNLRQKVGGKIP